MYTHDDHLAVSIVATLGLALTSGCAILPAPAPAPAAVCAVAPPAPPAAAPAAAAPPPHVTRVVARPAYVRPVVPPLPAGVYLPAARRASVPGRSVEAAKAKDDTKS
jgi:hypothetical protein